MDEPAEVYCYRCGRGTAEGAMSCGHCGASTTLSRAERILGVAYVLNELDREPIARVISPVERSRLGAYYNNALTALTGRARVQPAEASPAAVAAPSPAPIAPPTRAAPPRPPRPPREPMDWSWLVEQQANLFLFAGAFLTVVAALIYVGYSGQAVDGALKMALLTLYSVAFLAVGVICLRVPRVEIAGRVFFGVGAMLVPLNFVAARTLLTGENLSLTTLWLSGSVVTAAFYAAVACLGLGKPYAFSSGVAIVSATLATWAIPAALSAAGVAMCIGALALPRRWSLALTVVGGRVCRARAGGGFRRPRVLRFRRRALLRDGDL